MTYYIHSVNINSVDLNLLVAFEALLEERSVSRAARRIGLSQPAMSNALARLRGIFGDQLFERSPRGMTPTPRAEQMATAVRAGLEQFRRALSGEAAFDPARSERTFRIALSDHAEWLVLPQLVRAVAMESPSIRLQLRRVDGLFLTPEADLRTGALDLAIGFFPDARSLDALTRVEVLREERHAVVLRKGHPLLGRKLTLERFASAEHAAVIYRPEPWGLIDQELAARGLRRTLRVACPHFLSVLKIVAHSDLIATVPEGIARAMSKFLALVTRPLPLPLPVFATRVAWHAQMQNDPALSWLLNLLREAVRQSH